MENSTKNSLSAIGHAKVCPAALIVRDRRFLIGLRRYSVTHGSPDLWTTPGGRCQEGETVMAALIRETAEEVGITDLQILDFIGEVEGGHKDGTTVPCFICVTDQDPQLMEPDKFSNWHWADPWAMPEPFINRQALELLQQWLKCSER